MPKSLLAALSFHCSYFILYRSKLRAAAAVPHRRPIALALEKASEDASFRLLGLAHERELHAPAMRSTSESHETDDYLHGQEKR